MASLSNSQREHLPLARLTGIKSSVYKVNLVAKLIRRCHINTALLQLRFCKKKVAKDIYNVLDSAIHNAQHNHGADIDTLYVHEVLIGKDFILKRFRAKSKGRAGRILKPYVNVTVKLKTREDNRN